MNKKTIISDNSEWEKKVGYSRAIKIGNIIEVSGTTSTADGNIIGKDDPYLQTRFILEKIQTVLEKLNCPMTNVIRTRIYVTNIQNWEQIGKAHSEIFANIRPACSMVEVSNLIHSDLLVEIEVSAVI